MIAPSIPSEYEINVYGPTRATLVTKEYYTVTKEIFFDEEVEDTTNDGRNVKVKSYRAQFSRGWTLKTKQRF